ncbi:MAG: bifunctional 2-polyprenyl-6-hydroxyphenol methylase/3-demethylubiquinol 3-O-methyltransferase UbiG [Gammaproteobacteria bacterium]|nr:bifunctional 2-polyprenyl-6-hydroxyphenol methylase/3-demethylubiquinol 3-O-methyltransferase UbiG [Gammaproteobacteria bacterium]
MNDNLDTAERDKFAALASEWWDDAGAARTLHDINPCRLDYVQRQCRLDGALLADVGCGGGIFSESLARAGARVTAIDAAAELIEVARRHAQGAATPVHYETLTAEALAARQPAHFDVVTCMELVEHVPSPASLIDACARLLRPGGVLVMSTLNRGPLAYAAGIVLAEYVLRLLPRGTHDYAQFLRPAELAALAREAGLVTRDIRGMHYNPLTRRARLVGAPVVNYLATFARADA